MISQLPLPVKSLKTTDLIKGNSKLEIPQSADRKERSTFLKLVERQASPRKRNATPRVNKQRTRASIKEPQQRPQVNSAREKEASTDDTSVVRQSKQEKLPQAIDHDRLLGRESLRDLKRGSAVKEALLESSPIMAIVTGNIEKINPAMQRKDFVQSITKTPLVQDILDMNLQEVVNQEQPITEIFRSLGIDGNTADRIVNSLQINQDTPLTLKQFADEMGFDSGHMTTELKLLRQNVISGDLSRYTEAYDRLHGVQPGFVEGHVEGSKDQSERHPMSQPTLGGSIGKGKIRATGNPLIKKEQEPTKTESTREPQSVDPQTAVSYQHDRGADHVATGPGDSEQKHFFHQEVQYREQEQPNNFQTANANAREKEVAGIGAIGFNTLQYEQNDTPRTGIDSLTRDDAVVKTSLQDPISPANERDSRMNHLNLMGAQETVISAVDSVNAMDTRLATKNENSDLGISATLAIDKMVVAPSGTEEIEAQEFEQLAADSLVPEDLESGTRSPDAPLQTRITGSNSIQTPARVRLNSRQKFIEEIAQQEVTEEQVAVMNAIVERQTSSGGHRLTKDGVVIAAQHPVVDEKQLKSSHQFNQNIFDSADEEQFSEARSPTQERFDLAEKGDFKAMTQGSETASAVTEIKSNLGPNRDNPLLQPLVERSFGSDSAGVRAVSGQTEAVPESEFTFSRMRGDDIKRMINEIADRTLINVRNGGGTMKIRLNPQELGRITMNVGVNDNNVSLDIVAESQEIRRLIEDNINALKSALFDQEMNVDNYAVTVGREDFSQNDQQHEQHNWDQNQRQRFGEEPVLTQKNINKMRPKSRPVHEGAISIQA